MEWRDKIYNNSDIIDWKANVLLFTVRYSDKCHLGKKTMCSLKLKNQRTYSENKKTEKKDQNAGMT